MDGAHARTSQGEQSNQGRNGRQHDDDNGKDSKDSGHDTWIKSGRHRWKYATDAIGDRWMENGQLLQRGGVHYILGLKPAQALKLWTERPIRDGAPVHHGTVTAGLLTVLEIVRCWSRQKEKRKGCPEPFGGHLCVCPASGRSSTVGTFLRMTAQDCISKVHTGEARVTFINEPSNQASHTGTHELRPYMELGEL